MTPLLHPASELLLSPEMLPNASVIRRMLRYEDTKHAERRKGTA